MPRDILTLPAPPSDVRLSYGSDPLQIIDFRFASGSAPLVVHLHGGFWRNRFDLLHGGHICSALTAVGLTTANVEYRRVGDAGGGWPGTLDDALAALRFAQSRVPGQPTIITGHSAGGHLALCLGNRVPKLAGVVALGPVACLREAWALGLGSGAVEEFLQATPAQDPERYRAACPSLHKSAVPRVLIHGSADDIVPISVSRTYIAARAADPVSLIELPGADHFDPIDPRATAWSTVLATIRKLLSGG
jgi:acetyl esterase/lipase